MHFHPLVGAVIIPGLGLVALALLPFYDVHIENVGVYFRSRRGRYLACWRLGVPCWSPRVDRPGRVCAGLGSLAARLAHPDLEWAIPLAIVLLGLIGLDEVL